MPFIELDLEVNREALRTAVYEGLAERFPGWVAAPGNPETALTEEFCTIGADLAEIAVDVTPEIFRGFGTQIVNVTAQLAQSAVVASTWTMIDDAGYTIPAGTPVAMEVTGSESIGFLTVEEILVPVGETATTAGEVILRAAVPSSAPNTLTGLTLTLLDNLAFVESIAMVGAVSGGADEEDGDDYLDRLADKMQLLSPRPILAEDAAKLARTEVTGVWRATAIDGYDPGVNEVQQVATTGSPSAGTFTLTYSGQTTASIAYNAAAAAVQSALEALSNIAVGDVACAGGPLPSTPVTVTFTGTLASTNVAEMTVTDSITGGDAVVTTTTAGVAASTDNERMVSVAAIDVDGLAVSPEIKAEIDALLESEREINFLFYVIDPTYSDIDVAVSLVALAGFDTASVEATVEAALTSYLSPGNWGLDPSGQDSRMWRNVTAVRRFELVALVENQPGVDFVSTLTLALNGGGLGTADLTLDGVAALPLPGVISASVS